LGSFCEGKKQPKPPEPIAVEHDPQELLWVRFVIFMIQGRAESSSANGAAQLFGFVRGLQNCGERDATGMRRDAQGRGPRAAERGHPIPLPLAGSFHLTSMTQFLRGC